MSSGKNKEDLVFLTAHLATQIYSATIVAAGKLCVLDKKSARCQAVKDARDIISLAIEEIDLSYQADL